MGSTVLPWRAVMLAFGIMLLSGSAVYAALSVWPIGSGRGVASGVTGNAERGAYLSHMAGCYACHTDHKGEGAAYAGGAVLKTDFGDFHAPNITPDADHGLGAWTLAAFETALRHGVSPAGDPYYPAFPYPFYTRLTDRDVADLWAHLQTLDPVAAPAPPNRLVFPFNQRAGVKLWRAGYFEPGVLEPEEGRDAAWQRGRYIVEGPAHCGACHTPRDGLGGRDAARKFEGGDRLPGGGKSPAITTAALAAEGYGEDEIVFALQIGMLPSGDFFGDSMAEVVEHGTSKLSADDLRAIAVYLLDPVP
ncbi:MAG: cytochrome c [Alphaproteobacteria bacterium]|nr:cytochrome c [Alphaproteobacteria bacterium]